MNNDQISKNRKPRAQAMVEFALALPVLLMLLYGVMETGRLLFIYGSTVTAARQAVRYGSATGEGPNGIYYKDCAGIRAAAQRVGFINRFEDADIEISYDRGLDAGGTPLPIDGNFPDCETLSGDLENGDRILVSVSENWVPIVPLIVPLQPLTISSNSERTILAAGVDIYIPPEESTWTGEEKGCAQLRTVSASVNPYDHAGQVVTYTYNLWNIGSATLVSPGIVDNRVGGISCPASVNANTGYTCTGTYTITQADMDADYFENKSYPTPTCNPADKLQKTTRIDALHIKDLLLAKAPDIEASSIPGTLITYTYTLTNQGNVTLKAPFSVDDNRISNVDCSSAASPLAPGASTTCKGFHTITNQDIIDRQIINVARAYGMFRTEVVTSNDATAIVYTPPIYLVVVPTALTAIAPGQVINFTYYIKNITDVPIESPYVLDDLLTVDCSAASSVIQVGKGTTCKASYTVTQADMDAGLNITNVATAYGLRESEPVSSNTFTLKTPITQVAALGISLNSIPRENTPPLKGDTIDYIYTLTNTGNVTLTPPIAVSALKDANPDPIIIPIDCSAIQSNFPPGAVRTCIGEYEVGDYDIGSGSVVTNSYATAQFSSTVVQSNTIEETVATFTGPRFSIKVTADKSQATYLNEQITYTYTFTNTGGALLEAPYTVTSSLGSAFPSSSLDCSLAAGSIAPGGSTTCKSTYSVQAQGTITNTVTDATAMHSGAEEHASNLPVFVSTTAYICSSSNLKFTASPSSGGNGNKIVTWTVSNTVGKSLPISAVIIGWANSGDGSSAYHLDTVTVTPPTTLNQTDLPDTRSEYISGTGMLASGDTNITMTFSKNNPTGVYVKIIFADPFLTCQLPW